MPINVTCTQCGTTLRAPDTAAGKNIKCPKCAAVLPVPAAAPEPSSVQPPPAPVPAPPPMASAAPPRPRDDDDDYERSRRRGRDRDRDRDDDEPRFRRRDAAAPQSSGSNGICIGLGIGAICLGVVAGIFSLVPCCGAFVALPAGAIGLLLGLIGLLISLFAAQKSVGAIILTGAGSVINVIAIGIALLWWLYFGVQANRAGNQMQEALEKAQKMQQEEMERQKAIRDEQRRKKEEEANRVINSPEFQDAKKKSQENLRKISKALLDYEKKHGFLPNARFAGVGKDSPFPNNALSWRVAILPFLGYDDLYAKFDFNKGANDQVNIKAGQQMPDVFMSPRHPGEKRRTYYQVIVGDGLFGDKNSPPQTKTLSRPVNQVIMVVEAQNPVDWWQPNDVDFHQPFLPGLGGILVNNHFNAALANGDVVFISRASYTDEEIRELLPFNGGKAPPIWPPQQK